MKLRAADNQRNGMITRVMGLVMGLGRLNWGERGGHYMGKREGGTIESRVDFPQNALELTTPLTMFRTSWY